MYFHLSESRCGGPCESRRKVKLSQESARGILPPHRSEDLGWREDLGWLDDRGFGQREDLGEGVFGQREVLGVTASLARAKSL